MLLLNALSNLWALFKILFLESILLPLPRLVLGGFSEEFWGEPCPPAVEKKEIPDDRPLLGVGGSSSSLNPSRLVEIGSMLTEVERIFSQS